MTCDQEHCTKPAERSVTVGEPDNEANIMEQLESGYEDIPDKNGGDCEMEEVPQNVGVEIKEERLDGAESRSIQLEDDVYEIDIKQEQPDEDTSLFPAINHMGSVNSEDNEMIDSYGNKSRHVIDIRPSVNVHDVCQDGGVSTTSQEHPRPVELVQVIRFPEADPTEEANSSLAEPPLKIDGGSAKLGLTSLTKQASEEVTKADQTIPGHQNFPELTDIVIGEGGLTVCERDIKQEQTGDERITNCSQPSNTELPNENDVDRESETRCNEREMVDIKPSGFIYHDGNKGLTSGASFTKELAPRLAKLPLKIKGCVAKHGLTSLVLETCGGQPKSVRMVTDIGLPIKIKKIISKSSNLTLVKQCGTGQNGDIRMSFSVRSGTEESGNNCNMSKTVQQGAGLKGSNCNMLQNITPGSKAMSDNRYMVQNMRTDAGEKIDNGNMSQNVKPGAGVNTDSRHGLQNIKPGTENIVDNCGISQTLPSVVYDPSHFPKRPLKDAVLGQFYRINRSWKTVGGKQYRCLVCGEGSNNMMSMEDHVQTHLTKRPFTCTLCQKSFGQYYTLMKHKRLHTGERPHKCVVCDVSFPWRGGLQRHKHTVHGEPLPFQCPHCDKTTATSASLRSHIRHHTGEKPFLCYICAKTYKTSSALKRHIREHSEGKAYQCHICEKTFSTYGALNLHMVIHGGDKHLCDICGKLFTQKNSLLSHIRAHGASVKNSEIVSE